MKRIFSVTQLACLVVALLNLAVLPVSGAAPVGNRADAASSNHGKAILPATVSLTPAQLKDRDIKVAPASAGMAESTIQAPATAQFIQARVSEVGPRLQAKVVKATVNLGDKVRRGATLAILESVDLGKVKAAYLSIRSDVKLAREKYEREKRLVSQKISSEAELQKARAEFQQARVKLTSTIQELRLYGLSRKEIEAIQAGVEQPLSRYALTAPQAGIVEKLDITPGQTLTPEMTPIEIVDPARMWVTIDAFEKDVGRIKLGQKVVFCPRAISGAQFDGSVDWIARELSASTRTLQVRTTVTNTAGALRAGMFGTATIDVGGTKVESRAVLPVDAVQRVGGRRIVFKPVKGKPGTFAVVAVKTGRESGSRVEIVSGLSPGEPVVIHGSFALMAILSAGTRQDTD